MSERCTGIVLIETAIELHSDTDRDFARIHLSNSVTTQFDLDRRMRSLDRLSAAKSILALFSLGIQ